MRAINDLKALAFLNRNLRRLAALHTMLVTGVTGGGQLVDSHHAI
ncbi:hypothetical protein [Burkholderia glumae]|nr:hypothetical protein [Burkholderia glumae]